VLTQKDIDFFQHWGEAMTGGHRVVPSLVFILQNKLLHLSSHQPVIVLNLDFVTFKQT
jgi:hypothetical protein